MRRRSCLSVPGSSERFLERAPSIGADMTFLDLEDSVAQAEKAAARQRVGRCISTSRWDDRVLCVRVNAWDSSETYKDVIEVLSSAGDRLDELMLPKVSVPAEVVALDLLLSQVEREVGLPVGHVGIEAQIESVTGLQNVEAICAASSRLEAIVFGPADFAASVGMPTLSGGTEMPGYPGDHFHYVLSKILMAGRAAGLSVIDGPYLRISDLEGLDRYCRRSASLGYDGKWALHPGQVEVINEAFSPPPEQVEHARALLEAYEEATSAGQGAVRLGEEMIDEASRKMAERLLRRAGAFPST